MNAKMHNDTLFKGRQITVVEKRKNKPGMGHPGARGPGREMAQMMSIMQMMFKRGGMSRGFRGGHRGGHRGGPPGAGGPP